jgi:hypothetical protein
MAPHYTQPFDIVRTFPGYGAMVHVLADGRAIRMSITGPMMLTSVGGDFVRYLSDDELDRLPGSTSERAEAVA